MAPTVDADAPPPSPIRKVLGTVLVRCRMPATRRLHDNVRLRSGAIISVDHLWMLRGRWVKRPESQDPTWFCLTLGPFVLAYRIED